MFKFQNDPYNAIVTVSIQDGPLTMMYYPHGGKVQFCRDHFFIDSIKYIPTIEQTRNNLGRKIWIEKLTQ